MHLVHGMWIGPQLTAMELITIRSFQEHNCEFHLWHYGTFNLNTVPSDVVLENANEIIPENQIFFYPEDGPIDKDFGKGSYAGFSDIFRYRLLWEHGGWWTDMDITCLKEPDFKNEYVFRTHGRLPMVGNIMKCPPKSPLMKRCHQTAIREITKDNDLWEKPIAILVNNVQELGLHKYIHDLANKDYWPKIKHLYEDAEQEPPSEWYFVHWMNAVSRTKPCHRDSFFAKLARRYHCENLLVKSTAHLKWL